MTESKNANSAQSATTVLQPSRTYRVAEAIIGEAEKRLVNEALDTGWVSSAGPFVEKFEKSFAEHCGSSYAASVSNGTTALHLALAALGVGPGDEVIVPAITFVATASAVAHCGAVPVIADVDPDHWCLTPETIENVLTPLTRIIIPVHLFGTPAPLKEIQSAFPRIQILEDAAEAHGARLHGGTAGTIGIAGVFSFYGNKLLTTGEGGMIVTSDPELHDQIKRLRNHGTSPTKRYWHDQIGFNYRMTNIQAALGLAQMSRLDAVIEHRRNLASWYKQHLSDLDDIRFQDSVPDSEPVYWMIALCLDRWKTYEQRDEVMAELALHGIETRPMFYPLNEMPACANFPRSKSLDNAARIARSGIVLPSGPTLTEEDVAYICDRFKQALTTTGN
ncbi:MAG TPA: DegT/DnrJ/EryC1/StrS family aminotransferase [Blastocatellia bacterium]|nr:DegT/DnrJ/EryC1/StrS family aminotransferase [Blastocatellia bacterium]